MFLALAVGIVVGTAALNGPIVDGLRSNINRLTEDKRALESSVRELRTQAAASDEFALTVAPQLVAGELAEQRVLVVTTPDAPDELVDGLRPLLADAGASVTGQLEVLPAFGEPEQRQLTEDLVAQVVPSGLELPDGEPVERAAAELAAALTNGDDAIDPGEAQAVVSAFEEADLVSFTPEDGEELGAATMVVLVTGAGEGQAPDIALQQRHEALLALVRAFDERAGAAVVAGPASSALEDGLVQAVRGQSTLTGEVSTVDNLERALGRLAVVLALAEQKDGGSGQYGAGRGASAPLPVAAVS